MDRTGNQARMAFSGNRWRMFGILLFGYVLSFFTLGIYRFWVVTRKRRFFWSNTRIDGDALEYTGTAMQLLVGFLIAVGIFLPLYGLFFYLSTKGGESVVFGYMGAAIFLYFLAGYAAYRARRFLLSRTLWRGIRFSQKGKAWSYAVRRFLWTILTVLTLGLAYPFMAGSLWRYRYDHTWFGDRKCQFNGSWKTIAGPFYFAYFVMAGLVVAAFYLFSKTARSNGITLNSIGETPAAVALLVAFGVLLPLLYFYLRARITSRMLSQVSIGKARLTVRVRARSLLWQQISYYILLAMVSVGFLMLVGYVKGDVLAPLLQNKNADLSDMLKLGWYNLAIFGVIYLAFMATLAMLAELVFGLGFWRLVVRGALLSNEQDLRSVRADGEESALAGQGLADALNVGAY